METTIKVSQDFVKALKTIKNLTNQSYEEIMWDLLEPYLEFSPETKKAIEESKRDAKHGKTFSLEEVKKELGFGKKNES